MNSESLTNPPCPLCGGDTSLQPTLIRYRRGSKVLPVDSFVWQCNKGCSDPHDGTTPYQFVDLPLMAWSETQAQILWKERFSEEMPPSERPRIPKQQHTIRVPVLLTEDEARRLDQSRGELSRNEFIRQAIEQAVTRNAS